MARIIAIANEKGGVGKTTASLNSAAVLARMGYKVLQIDNDPQSNATTGCKVSEAGEASTLYEVYVDGAPISEAIIKTEYEFDVVPACKDLAGAEKVAQLPHPSMLRMALQEVVDRYDFIIIDHPPTVGFLVVNGLVAASEVLIPMIPEEDAFNGAKRVVGLVRDTIKKSNLNKELKVTGIFAMMYDPRLILHNEVMAKAREFCEAEDIRFIETHIKRSVRFAEAKYLQVPAVIADSKTPAVQDFERLVIEALGVGQCHRS